VTPYEAATLRIGDIIQRKPEWSPDTIIRISGGLIYTIDDRNIRFTIDSESILWYTLVSRSKIHLVVLRR
jgi:hypothetical protein